MDSAEEGGWAQDVDHYCDIDELLAFFNHQTLARQG